MAQASGTLLLGQPRAMIPYMPDHKIGSNYSFAQLMNAYKADPQGEGEAHFLLYRGDEILALCLRHKFNPKPGEVWVGDAPAVAEWGKKLAALKGQKALPLYYAPRSRTLYEFKGLYSITSDTDDPQEVAKRKGPVPLSRVVFIEPGVGSGRFFETNAQSAARHR